MTTPKFGGTLSLKSPDVWIHGGNPSEWYNVTEISKLQNPTYS